MAPEREKDPIMMEVRANWKVIRALASFTRLSPSRIVTILLGILICLNTEVAATASGGDMIAPKRKPIPNVKPGRRARATKPMAMVVIMTRPMASVEIGSIFFLKSTQLVFHAAEYKMGGKKTMSTIEGSRNNFGNPGIKLSSNPVTVNNTGKTILSLRAYMEHPTINNINRIKVSIDCM
jgi:hypothetical protein